MKIQKILIPILLLNAISCINPNNNSFSPAVNTDTLIQPVQKWTHVEAVSKYNSFLELNVLPNLENTLSNFQIIDRKNDPTRIVLEGMNTALLPESTLSFVIEGEERRIDLTKSQSEKFITDLYYTKLSKSFNEERILNNQVEPKLNRITAEISTYYHFPENITYIIYNSKYYRTVTL